MSNNKLAGTKREQNRNNLISAYEAYQRREPRSMDNLLAVVRKFAYMKLYHLEHDFKDFGSAETVDDWAQDVVFKVWQALDKDRFEGTPAEFYSWVHKIAFNRSTDAFNDLQDEKAIKVPLFIKSKEGGDENGDDYEEENPAIYEEDGDASVAFHIPASVQGIDLTICKLLLTEVRGTDGNHRGRNYAEVGFVLGMTEDAVKKRLSRLQQRLKAEGQQKKGGTTDAVAAD